MVLCRLVAAGFGHTVSLASVALERLADRVLSAPLEAFARTARSRKRFMEVHNIAVKGWHDHHVLFDVAGRATYRRQSRTRRSSAGTPRCPASRRRRPRHRDRIHARSDRGKASTKPRHRERVRRTRRDLGASASHRLRRSAGHCLRALQSATCLRAVLHDCSILSAPRSSLCLPTTLPSAAGG